ncbi:MAG TPA: hypothetical protein VFH97_07725 [Gemmatimonadales bacterium]|nr:hypothetical protein [Gemmatimonadales bacterium]
MIALPASVVTATEAPAAPRPPADLALVGMVKWCGDISHHLLSWQPSPDESGPGRYRTRYRQIAPVHSSPR